MKPGALGRARSSTLLQGSAWIMIGLATQAIVGLAFWLLAARVATSSELGRASALFTATQFINYLTGLGLTIALARHMTRRGHESDALFGWSVVATIISSFIGGIGYLAVTHTSATELVQGSVWGWLSFCIYTAGVSVSLLVEVRLMAERRWAWVVGRIAVIGIVRLPFVFVQPDMRIDAWLYHLLFAPTAFAGFIGVPMLTWMGIGKMTLRRPIGLGPYARYAGVNWMATLASQAPQFLLPLVVAQSVAPSVNASFFLAWTLTSLVFLVPGAISQVLLLEGSKDADDPAAGIAKAAGRARQAMIFSLALAVVAWLGCLVAGPVVSSIFGDDYEALARLLPSLMLAGIPWAVTSARLAEARIRKDQFATIAITVTLGFGILVPVLLFVPSQGTLAATRAWLFGHVAGAVVAMIVHRRAGSADPQVVAVSSPA